MSSADSTDEVTTLKSNTVLFCEGEPSTHLYIVKRGKIRIVKEINKSLVPVSLIREEEFVGELSLFDDAPRSASAIAVEDTQVVLVMKNDIRKMLKTCPEWVANILNTLCERLKASASVLAQHHITDDIDEDAEEVSAEQLSKYLKMIQDYKKRKGIH